MKKEQTNRPGEARSRRAWGNPHVRGTRAMHPPQTAFVLSYQANHWLCKTSCQNLPLWPRKIKKQNATLIVHMTRNKKQTHTPLCSGNQNLITRLLCWESLDVTSLKVIIIRLQTPKGIRVYLTQTHPAPLSKRPGTCDCCVLVGSCSLQLSRNEKVSKLSGGFS